VDPADDEDGDDLQKNVSAIAALSKGHERGITRHHRAIAWVMDLIGRPFLLWAEIAFVTAWVLAARARDPPPFYWLQGLVGFCSLLLTTMVLIAQNRQRVLAEGRAHLDTQFNLAIEQKVTKLIGLVEELRRDLPVRDRIDSQADSMARPTDPHEVSRRLEQTLAPESLKRRDRD
jgi:uncharacterized membrane protein